MDYSKDYNDLPTSFFDGEVLDEENALLLDDVILGGLPELPIQKDREVPKIIKLGDPLFQIDEEDE